MIKEGRDSGSAVGSRLSIIETASGAGDRALFAKDVAAGLTRPRKALSCRYFYDEEGSRLFDEICALEEYTIPRDEREILEQHATEIALLLPHGGSLIELGSGNASKTCLIIEALLERQGTLSYVPIDVSRSALEASARDLVQRYPSLSVIAVAGEYGPGLRRAAPSMRGSKLVLWLGSNIGNFDREGAASFLRALGGMMSRGDRVLVGIDLRKDKRTLEKAYDDARGVTASFNKNILSRINRSLGADFDLSLFDHRAVYQEEPGRIEMHLVSTIAQRVHVAAIPLDVDFEAGESIHTEDSYKYSPEEIRALAERAGYLLEQEWLDQNRRFCEALFRIV